MSETMCRPAEECCDLCLWLTNLRLSRRAATFIVPRSIKLV